MSDRNKIAQEMSVDELDQFITELAALPGKERTLKAIAEKAAARGITISLMSAKAFRETTFENYLKRIERRREFAERVAKVRDKNTGSTFADAASDNLAEQIFDLTEELGEGEQLDLKKASSVAFIISKIRQGDVASGGLQLKLKEYERRENDRAEKNAQAAAQLQKLRDPSAGLNQQERDTILDEVDRLMGVK